MSNTLLRKEAEHFVLNFNVLPKDSSVLGQGKAINRYCLHKILI